MRRDLIVGVDAGTSVIKSVAFSLEGGQVGIAGRPNSYVREGAGGIEQDMARTWRDTAETLRELASGVPRLRERLAAVAVTGQGDGTWLVDADGAPVGGGLLWLDSRAAAFAEAFVQRADYPAHYATTGTGVNACQQGTQLAWMRQHQPGRLAQAATAMHCKDWLYLQLTGVRATDSSEACFSFGDFRTGEYAPAIAARLGLEAHAHLLPPIVDGASRRDALSADAASECGLEPGTPVVLGYVDIICSALGGALYDPGRRVGCSVLGSTGMHMRLAQGAGDVLLNEARSGYTMRFPAPGVFAQMQSSMAATINIDWLLGIASQASAMAGGEADRATVLAGLEVHVASAAPGGALYHPYILEAGERGPFMDANARAQFSGLSSGTDLPGLFRAVFEGLAFAARDCYAAMGPLPDEIRLTGGAARSASLRTIMASVLGVPIRSVAREETGAAGAAMIAAVNLGVCVDVAACVEAWVKPTLGAATLPDPTLTSFYDGMFPIYLEVRKGMTGAWRAMEQLRRTLP